MEMMRMIPWLRCFDAMDDICFDDMKGAVLPSMPV